MKMPRTSTKKQVVTVPEAKRILESIGEEQLDQFQRRSLDYAAKFSKVDSKIAGKIVKNLVEQFELEEGEAVQIVNCMPESIEEIRVFLAGGHKIVETTKLEAILVFLDKHRKKE
jgi:DNA-directed RNA polymerase subunit F